MVYKVAEKFRSIQGEGVYAGTPMAFIRFVGCSVGKSICSACDTDFEQPVTWRGGGEFSEHDLLEWTQNYDHICLTGGEPLDQDLQALIVSAADHRMFHIETSGTKRLPPIVQTHRRWIVESPKDNVGSLGPYVWVCVSPKPGFIESVVVQADEVKVIMPGLGVLKQGVPLPATVKDATFGLDLRWPTLEDALRWARAGKTVFLQPRNERLDVDMNNLRLCQDIIAEHPELRLSVQLHKILRVQ